MDIHRWHRARAGAHVHVDVYCISGLRTPTGRHLLVHSRPGVTLRFRVTATFTDSTTTTDTVTHTIRGHGGPWVYHFGVLAGVGVNPPVL